MPLRLLKKIKDKLLGSNDGELVSSKAETKKSVSRPKKQASKPRKKLVSEEWKPGQSGKAAETAAKTPRKQRKSTPSKPTKPKQPEKRWTIEDFVVPEEEGRKRFHDFDIPWQVMRAIQDLGFKYCTPIQAESLALVDQGKNVAGQAQTGTGKTAAFLIGVYKRMIQNRPSTEREKGHPRALVIAPTRELVIQIAKDSAALGKYCRDNTVGVYGGMDLEKQASKLREQSVEILVATPGRLLDFVRRGVINLKSIETLVIDEADRMLDMGFIPDVRQIVRACSNKENRQTLLYSATLNDDVMRLASQWMPDPVTVSIEPESVAVDTVEQIVYMIRAEEKPALLYNLLKKDEFKRTIVFANRRVTTELVTENLKRWGVKSFTLSGSVAQNKRVRILDDFKAGKIDVLVATDVAGRGIHIDGVSHVINYDFPYEPPDYVHRIGRTGRAGKEGTSVSFACEDESFIIPDIEAYIGRELKCTVPAEDLLNIPEGVRPPLKRLPSKPRDNSRGPSRGGPSRGGPKRSGSRRPPQRRRP